jgi:predicted nucleotidyltransferase
MNDFGLNASTLHTLHHYFANQTGIDCVIIYGSRATGTYQNGSDIDFAIRCEDARLIGKIMSDLQDLPIPYLCDVTDYNRLTHADLKAQIDAHGKVFFEKPTVPTNPTQQKIPLVHIFRALFLAPIIGFLPLLIFMLFYDFHAALPVYGSCVSFSYLFVIFLALPATLILRLFIFQISVTACTLWGFALGGIVPLFNSLTVLSKEGFFAGLASLTLPLLIGIIGAFPGFVFGKLIQPEGFSAFLRYEKHTSPPSPKK